jgi:hypothetical protein
MTRLALVFPLLIILGNGTVAQDSPTQDVSPKADPPGLLDAPRVCDGKFFPIYIGGSSSCCQVGNDLFHVSRYGGLAHRKTGRACTEADGISTNCFGTEEDACHFGPCGGAKPPDDLLLHGWDTKIFKPNSNPKVCGYQVTHRAVPGSGVPDTHVNTTSVPEPWTDQWLYPSVAPACPYTTCRKGGIPADDFNIIVLAVEARGRVKIDPPDITLSGPAKASWTSAETVTLTAEPTDKYARAVFSGDCIKTGDYGKKAECSVKPSPNPKITVTFECQKGFACERGDKD